MIESNISFTGEMQESLALQNVKYFAWNNYGTYDITYVTRGM